MASNVVRHPRYGLMYQTEDGFVCPARAARRWQDKRKKGEPPLGDPVELCLSRKGRYYYHFLAKGVEFITPAKAAMWLIERGYTLPDELREMETSVIE
jgi:hypothetical protein